MKRKWSPVWFSSSVECVVDRTWRAVATNTAVAALICPRSIKLQEKHPKTLYFHNCPFIYNISHQSKHCYSLYGVSQSGLHAHEWRETQRRWKDCRPSEASTLHWCCWELESFLWKAAIFTFMQKSVETIDQSVTEIRHRSETCLKSSQIPW